MACDAEDYGLQMQNDEEIVTSMQKESDPVDDETDEDEDNNSESSKGPSNANAFSMLETVMEWYEQSECCPAQLLLLKRTRDLAVKKRSHFQVVRTKSELPHPSPHPAKGEDFEPRQILRKSASPHVPSRHGGTINSHRAASPLVRLVEGEDRWEAPDHPQVSSPKIGMEAS
ncbi:uncharacterized protein TNCV_106281 [Trichonephila clavipes]|nr:uncharacterized protein TNCV_106281 [Trichonephila clavipes]